jgi:hypothetical protein
MTRFIITIIIIIIATKIKEFFRKQNENKIKEEKKLPIVKVNLNTLMLYIYTVV